MRDPVADPWTISSPFGYRVHPITHVRTLHEGIDIPEPVGTPCYATLAGRVAGRGYNPAAGNYLILEHGSTTRTRYNHLKEVPALRLNETVTEGQIVARTGNTGATTGPHLHFGVYEWRAGRWAPTNPVPWLAAGQTTGGETKPPAPPSTNQGEEDDMDIGYVRTGAGAGVYAVHPWVGKKRLITAAEWEAAKAAGAKVAEISRAEIDKIPDA